MALGSALVLAQLLGSGANYLIGRKQKLAGEELAKAGREAMLATAGPTAETLAGVQEQKGLLAAGQQRTQERLDSSVAGLLDALQSGDQSTISALVPGYAGDVAQAGADVGFQTARAMAAANQPLIEAAEKEADVSRGLAQFDFQTGTEAFNKGQQLQYDAIGQALDIPMDLATFQTANPDAFGSMFPGYTGDGMFGFKPKSQNNTPDDKSNETAQNVQKIMKSGETPTWLSNVFPTWLVKDRDINALPREDGGVVKTAQAGAYIGDGINPRTIRDLLAAMPKKKDEEEDKGKKNEEKKEEKKLKVGEPTDTVDTVENLAAMGGVMKPGDVFRTPGPENHDKKEFDIVDGESGQVVARTTGQENHTINNDDSDQKYKIVDKDTREVLAESEGGSMSVLNSDQSGSIHDAFKNVDVGMLLKFLDKYPQKKEVRELMSALNVFTLPQFQD